MSYLYMEFILSFFAGSSKFNLGDKVYAYSPNHPIDVLSSEARISKVFSNSYEVVFSNGVKEEIVEKFIIAAPKPEEGYYLQLAQQAKQTVAQVSKVLNMRSINNMTPIELIREIKSSTSASTITDILAYMDDSMRLNKDVLVALLTKQPSLISNEEVKNLLTHESFKQIPYSHEFTSYFTRFSQKEILDICLVQHDYVILLDNDSLLMLFKNPNAFRVCHKFLKLEQLIFVCRAYPPLVNLVLPELRTDDFFLGVFGSDKNLDINIIRLFSSNLDKMVKLAPLLKGEYAYVLDKLKQNKAFMEKYT